MSFFCKKNTSHLWIYSCFVWFCIKNEPEGHFSCLVKVDTHLTNFFRFDCDVTYKHLLNWNNQFDLPNNFWFWWKSFWNLYSTDTFINDNYCGIVKWFIIGVWLGDIFDFRICVVVSGLSLSLQLKRGFFVDCEATPSLGWRIKVQSIGFGSLTGVSGRKLCAVWV